jgi:hypothetical protein
MGKAAYKSHDGRSGHKGALYSTCCRSRIVEPESDNHSLCGSARSPYDEKSRRPFVRTGGGSIFWTISP